MEETFAPDDPSGKTNTMFMQNDDKKNIETVERFYKAISRGDLATARRILDREVEWIESDRTALWFRGTHHGACTVFNEVILPAYGWIADFRMELDQFLAVGEHVVAIGRFRGQAKTTDRELNALATHVWTLHEGRAMRVQTFNDPRDWSKVLNQGEAQEAAA